MLTGRIQHVQFAATIFISAFLLFQIQPLISKSILPWFGGSPGVWTTCMLFFQLLLFAGYLYAHLVTTRCSSRTQGLLHITLLAVSAGMLSVMPEQGHSEGPISNRDPEAIVLSAEVSDESSGSSGVKVAPNVIVRGAPEEPLQQIILVLLTTVGFPYFLLSTTGPLLLRWFSLLCPQQQPYRLYALSNAGSLLALLSFPFLFEPLLKLSTLIRVWEVAYLLFVIFCIPVALQLIRHHMQRRTSSEAVPDSAAITVRSAAFSQRPSSAAAGAGVGIQGHRTASLNWRGIVRWLFLAMTASTALLAETNEVCQDVAVIPFLWIVPLSLYLLSFILCFESDRWYQRSWYAVSTMLLIIGICWIQSFGVRSWLPVQLLIYFGGLFCICMLCHGELARTRPPAQHLTAFYLTVSAGGAIGGLFVAVAAPLIFPAFWEHSLTLIAAVVLALMVYSDDRDWLTHSRRPPLWFTSLAIVLLVGTGTVLAVSVLNYQESIEMRRNFYGVLEVKADEIEDAIILRHGRIIHGLQVRSSKRFPTMYYGLRSGVGRAIEVLRERRTPLNMGLVGLGAGTLAAYGQEGDRLRFYEINEDVTELALTHFSFLKDCPSQVEIIHGDARLRMSSEPPQNYDLLVLDAFSGDAVPVHLLTREAMEIFLSHLAPEGILAFHISNIHFDLRRVTEALADVSGMNAMTLDAPPLINPADGLPSLAHPSSRWVLMARSTETLRHDQFSRIAVNSEVPVSRRILWTDDFSNLIQALDRN